MSKIDSNIEKKLFTDYVPNECSSYEQSINNYELMIKWTEELNERLGNLKFDMEYKNK